MVLFYFNRESFPTRKFFRIQYYSLLIDDTAAAILSDATKQLLIHHPPKILLLQLKRFNYFNYQSSRKNNTHIIFPVLLDLAPYCWGEPERAPHKSVVNVGWWLLVRASRVRQFTLHNTVVGWSYERRVPDNLLYKYGSYWLGDYTSVVCSRIYKHVLWTSSSWGVELMASNEDRLRRRRERDRLRRQMETAEEREARSIYIYIYI